MDFQYICGYSGYLIIAIRAMAVRDGDNVAESTRRSGVGDGDRKSQAGDISMAKFPTKLLPHTSEHNRRHNRCTSARNLPPWESKGIGSLSSPTSALRKAVSMYELWLSKILTADLDPEKGEKDPDHHDRLPPNPH